MSSLPLASPVRQKVPALKPEVCKHRVTITLDRMLDNHRRLIVEHSQPGEWPADRVLVFGCVGGQPKAVLKTAFWSDARIAHAAPNEVIVSSSQKTTQWQRPWN